MNTSVNKQSVLKTRCFRAAAVLLVLAPFSAQAASRLTARERYLTIKGKPHVTVVQEESAPPLELNRMGLLPDGNPASVLGDVSLSLSDIGQIINLGKQLWEIIAANKPVVNVSTDSASALPKGATSWTDLSGWQAPASRLYRFTYENLFGMNVVDFSYRVLYSYGGSVGGKGQYLSNVTVVPADLSVLWGYTFNAKASVPAVLNASSDPAAPMGAVQLLIDWKIDTVIKHEETSQSYYVKGDGSFADLSN